MHCAPSHATHACISSTPHVQLCHLQPAPLGSSALHTAYRPALLTTPTALPHTAPCLTLPQAFDKIDTDGSGLISLAELAAYMRAQEYIVDDEALEIFMKSVDKDGDNSSLDFEEFVFVLGKFTASEDVSDLLGRFVDHVASSLVVRLARQAKPIFKDMEEELDFQHGGREHWRLSLARIVDGAAMHMLLLLLLLVDFVAVILMIFLGATGCEPEPSATQVNTYNALHSVSIHILCVQR